MGNVVISPNIQKTSTRIDASGNVIDPRTKQIIQPVQEAYIPPAKPVQQHVEEPQASTTIASSSSGTLSVLDQIKQAKENLKALEELKQIKIAEKKAELDLLQQ